MRRRRGVHGVAEALWPLAAPMALVAVLALPIHAAGGEVLDRVATTGLINLVLVVGLYVFVGNSGVFSFGHIAFAAVGAYTAGIFTIPPTTENGVTGKDVVLSQLPGPLERLHTGPLVGTLAGGAVAAILAALVSIPLMRLSGIAASIATFAVLIIVNVVATNWQQLTNGTAGLAGVPATTTTPVALCWSLVAMVLAFGFQGTRFCLRLRASREDEVASRASGIGIYWERRYAFVLSAFIVGAGGALFAQYIGAFGPGAFYLSLTFITVAMLVIGGMTSLAGAVVGSVFIAIVQEVLRRIEDAVSRPSLAQLCLAAIMLAVLVLRPSGLTGGREAPLPTTFVRRLVAREPR